MIVIQIFNSEEVYKDSFIAKTLNPATTKRKIGKKNNEN